MRKKILIAAWLLVPVVLFAVHYGPGQTGLSRDKAAEKIAKAQAAETTENWSDAVQLYSDALADLPSTDAARRYQLRLAQAKARINSGELPEAKADLEGLLADAQKSGVNPALIGEIRASLAGAEYYSGWLMRLEGAATEEWMAETESSRQHFRLLAEESKQSGLAALATDHQKNLEAVVRLELMDLSELKGLALPKQCKNCSNCSSKCRAQRASACKNPGNGHSDARQKISEEKKSGAGKSSREGTGS
ncbi:MAG: hypothetical protein QOF48_686 [Verrucomicrobiota bacterium]|jgi:hypothetical protein